MRPLAIRPSLLTRHRIHRSGVGRLVVAGEAMALMANASFAQPIAVPRHRQVVSGRNRNTR
jgi:hypothetical protein